MMTWREMMTDCWDEPMMEFENLSTIQQLVQEMIENLPEENSDFAISNSAFCQIIVEDLDELRSEHEAFGWFTHYSSLHVYVTLNFCS
jgi:hypothetical protein